MHALITYAVRPDALAEHLALVAEVYADLHRLALGHLAYATYQLEDELTFVEVFSSEDGAGGLAASAAFTGFRSSLESRTERAPEVTDLRLVGSYTPARPRGGVAGRPGSA